MARYGEGAAVGYGEPPKRTQGMVTPAVSAALVGGGARSTYLAARPSGAKNVAAANLTRMDSQRRVNDLKGQAGSRTRAGKRARNLLPQEQATLRVAQARYNGALSASAHMLAPAARVKRAAFGVTGIGLGSLGLSRSFQRRKPDEQVR
jgi:hypothetical protein